MILALYIAGGLFVAFFLVSAINSLIYEKKCRDWCEKRGMKVERVDFKDGRYGYVGRDENNFRYVKIPEDFGEPSESMGVRLREFSWQGTDKKAVENDGSEVRLDYIGKKRDLV